jgi:hypothetical protein
MILIAFFQTTTQLRAAPRMPTDGLMTNDVDVFTQDSPLLNAIPLDPPSKDEYFTSDLPPFDSTHYSSEQEACLTVHRTKGFQVAVVVIPITSRYRVNQKCRGPTSVTQQKHYCTELAPCTSSTQWILQEALLTSLAYVVWSVNVWLR